MVTTEEKEVLLGIARGAIAAALRGERFAAPSGLTPELERPGAAFVTLHIAGGLRGCIGTVEPVDPLHRTVASVAVSAALRDPRFPPLDRSELDSVDIEISVLTPRARVTDPAEIEVGRDGLVVSLGGRAGLLLPQVAPQYGWDRTEFLEYTCRKAGLPPDAWKDPRCVIERFSAVVFSERRDGLEG